MGVSQGSEIAYGASGSAGRRGVSFTDPVPIERDIGYSAFAFEGGAGGSESLAARRRPRQRGTRRRVSLGVPGVSAINGGGGRGGAGGGTRLRRRPFNASLDPRRFGRISGIGDTDPSGAGAGGGGGGGPVGVRRGRLLTLYSGVSSVHGRAQNALCALLFDTRTPGVTPEQENVDQLFSFAYMDACQRSLAGQDVSRAFAANEEFQSVLDERHPSLYQQNQALLSETVARHHHDVVSFIKDVIDAEDRQLAALAAEREGEISQAPGAGAAPVDSLHPERSFFSGLDSTGLHATTVTSSTVFSPGPSIISAGSPMGGAPSSPSLSMPVDVLQQRLSEAWLHYTVRPLGRVMAWNGFFFCFWHSAVGEQYGERECRASRWVLECHVLHLHVPLCYHVRYKGRGVTVLSLIPVAESMTTVTDQNSEIAAMGQEVASAFSLLPYVSAAPRADGTYDGASLHYIPRRVQTHLGRDGRYYFIDNRHWLPRWISSRRTYDYYSQRLSTVTPRLLATRRVSLSCRAFDSDAFIGENKGAIEFMKHEINHGLSDLLKEERDAKTRRAARRAKRAASQTLARAEAARQAVEAADEAQRKAGGGTLAVPVFTPVTSPMSSADSGPLNGNGNTASQVRRRVLDRDAMTELLCGSSDSSSCSSRSSECGAETDADEAIGGLEKSPIASPTQKQTTPSPGSSSSAPVRESGSIIRRFNRVGYPKNLLGALLITLTCFPAPPLRYIREVKREILFRGFKAFVREQMYQVRFGVQAAQAQLPNSGVVAAAAAAATAAVGRDSTMSAWDAAGGTGAANKDDERLWVDEGEWDLTHAAPYDWAGDDDDDDLLGMYGWTETMRRGGVYLRGGRVSSFDDSNNDDTSVNNEGDGASRRQRKVLIKADPKSSSDGEGTAASPQVATEESFGVKARRFVRLFMGKAQVSEEEAPTQAEGNVTTPVGYSGANAANNTTAAAEKSGPTARKQRGAPNTRLTPGLPTRSPEPEAAAAAAAAVPPASAPQGSGDRRGWGRRAGAAVKSKLLTFFGLDSIPTPSTKEAATTHNPLKPHDKATGVPTPPPTSSAAAANVPPSSRGATGLKAVTHQQRPPPLSASGLDSARKLLSPKNIRASRQGKRDQQQLHRAESRTSRTTSTTYHSPLQPGSGASVPNRWPDFTTLVERLLVAFMQYDGTQEPDVFYARHQYHCQHQQHCAQRSASSSQDLPPWQGERGAGGGSFHRVRSGSLGSMSSPLLHDSVDADDEVDEMALEESEVLNNFYTKVVLPRVYRKFRLSPRLVDLYTPLEEEDKQIVYDRLCTALGVRVSGGRVVETVPTLKDFTPNTAVRRAGRHSQTAEQGKLVPCGASADNSSPGSEKEKPVYPLPRWVLLRMRLLVDRLMLPSLELHAVHQREWELHGAALVPFLGLRCYFPKAEETPEARELWERAAAVAVSHVALMPGASTLLYHGLEQECYECYFEAGAAAATSDTTVAAVATEADGAAHSTEAQQGISIFNNAFGSLRVEGNGLELAIQLRRESARTEGDRAVLLSLMRLQALMLARMIDVLEAANEADATGSQGAEQHNKRYAQETSRLRALTQAADTTCGAQHVAARRAQRAALVGTLSEKLARCAVEAAVLADLLLSDLKNPFSQLYRRCTAELVDCLPAIAAVHSAEGALLPGDVGGGQGTDVPSGTGADTLPGGRVAHGPLAVPPEDDNAGSDTSVRTSTSSAASAPELANTKSREEAKEDAAIFAAAVASTAGTSSEAAGLLTHPPSRYRFAAGDGESGGSYSGSTGPSTASATSSENWSRFLSEAGAIRHMLRQLEKYCSHDLLLAQDYLRQGVLLCHRQQDELRDSSPQASSGQRSPGNAALGGVEASTSCSYSCSTPLPAKSGTAFSALYASSASPSTATSTTPVSKEEVVKLFESAYAIFGAIDGKSSPRALRALANLAVYRYTMGDYAEWQDTLQQLRASWRDGGPEDIKQLLVTTYSDFLASRLATSAASAGGGTVSGLSGSTMMSPRQQQQQPLPSSQRGFFNTSGGMNWSLFQSLRDPAGHISASSFPAPSPSPGGFSFLSFSSPAGVSGSVAGTLATPWSGATAMATGPSVRFLHVSYTA